MLGLLLRQRGRLFWNRLSKGPHGRRRVVGAGLAAGLSIGVVTLAGLNAGLIVDRVERADPVAAAEALPVLLVGVTALTLVTSLSSAFHHLFMASDLELLLVAPVPSRDIFWLKVAEIWRDSLHVLLFQAAALYGYGQTLRLPLTYYALALVVGVCLTLAATAVGAIVTLLIARVRFGDSILGLSRLLAVLLLLPIGLLGVPALGFGRRFSLLLNQGSVDSLASSLRGLGPPPTWAPTTWAAHLLLGDEAAGLSSILLVVSAVALVAVAQRAFDGLFQAGWERVRFTAPHTLAGSARRQHAGKVVRAPSGPIFGLLLKDWRTLWRDPRWRTGALVSLVALGLPAMVLFAGDPLARSPHAIHFWFGMVPVPYLAYLFGSQHGAATLVYEGRNIALLRAAPIGIARIMLAKVLGGLVLVLGVTWAATLALAIGRGGEPLEIGAALVAATWLACGATVAAVAGAALTADFEGDNPSRRVGCVGMAVTATLSIFFFAANTGVLVWWVIRSALSVPRPFVGLLPIADWGLPLLAVLSVGAIALASRMGMRRLAAWELS